MLDTVDFNHVQHISFTQSRLTDAVSVILNGLLSYEHPPNAGAVFILTYCLAFGFRGGAVCRGSLPGAGGPAAAPYLRRAGPGAWPRVRASASMGAFQSGSMGAPARMRQARSLNTS